MGQTLKLDIFVQIQDLTLQFAKGYFLERVYY